VTTSSALPDDPDQLKTMLLAERAESERLRQDRLAANAEHSLAVGWLTALRSASTL